jgi:hypothetical protein
MDFYAPPQQLEVPKSDQYDYRWVAEFVMGGQTPRSVQIRIREGYERVRLDTLPEDFIVDEDERQDGFARTGGLILMRIDKRRRNARTKYYRTRSAARLEAADELQGIAGRNAVREDRGTQTLSGADAGRALAKMSQT